MLKRKKKGVSDKETILKLTVKGVALNVSGFAPKVSCKLEKKMNLWREMDEVVQGIPEGREFIKRLVGQNRSDEEVMCKLGVQDRNTEQQKEGLRMLVKGC